VSIRVDSLSKRFGEHVAVEWLRRLHDEVHVTSIFVTHDQEEAFAIADRMLVINPWRSRSTTRPTGGASGS
jgi:ABC-type sulfate/molybdate transport systems ATPase subunit